MAGVAGSKANSGPTLFSGDDDSADVLDALALELTVVDRDTIDELRSYADGGRTRAVCAQLRCGSACWRCGRPAAAWTPI